MALSVQDIRKKISEHAGRDTVARATSHQNRIKFHVQTSLTPVLLQPVNDFYAFVKNLLPHDKYKTFLELFRYPVRTNEVTATCFDKLSRIFDGRNPAFNFQFRDADSKADWEEYRKNRLNEPKVWATRGWENFQTEINSVLIVDLPEVQTGELPEPYFYWLPIESVLAFETDSDGRIEWIAFKQDGDKVAVFDDAFFRVFRRGKAENAGALISEKPHDLGYCPARFFWDEPISLRDINVKRSPLTKELEALDWYLFYATSKKHLDLYGSYPIYSGYEQACDYSNAENGDYCDGGFLKDRRGFYLYDSASNLIPCPKCGKKRIIGAGSFVEVPVPRDGQPDLRNPVSMLSVDRSSLDYNVDELERLKNEIITSVVGTTEEITQRDALNEQQIQANFESQSAVLNRVKKGFEAAQEWTDATVCRLRYGEDFTSAEINYGTDFFLYDASKLRERYAAAKRDGASEAELDALHEQIVATEYRHNPAAERRMLTLSDIEPFRHLTRDEVYALYEKGLVSREDLLVKLDFAGLVRRFERENTNVLDFGSEIPYQRKIDTIKEKLREYAAENINKNLNT